MQVGGGLVCLPTPINCIPGARRNSTIGGVGGWHWCLEYFSRKTIGTSQSIQKIMY